MAHKHSIYDSDLHFIIDPITRKIKSESGKVILMQNDHNSERFTFQIPRYIEGHDMSLCNTTEIHYVNTDSENKRNQNEDIYPVTDLQVSPESEDIVIGSWLISQNATTYSGALNFIMRFACVNDKQELEYQWFTDVYSVIQIAKGIYNVDVMTNNDDPDLLAAWKNECLELTTNATTEICNKAIEKTTSIRDEAVDTLSGIRNEAVDTMNNICSEAKTEMVEVRDEAVTAITNIRNEAIDTSNETDEAISEFSKKLSDTVFMVNFETGDLEYESQNYTFSVNPVTGNLEWEYVGTPSGGIVGLADQLAKSKSDAIVLTAEGESIVVEDSSDDPFHGLRVFGKTTQNGTPTPDAPVPLVCVGDAGSVKVSITDGTEDNVQSLTLQTPTGLPGIPVNDESLATYTDADGQMWCSDEIDFERGVYVQRVLVIEDLESLSHFNSYTTSDGRGITVQYDTGCTLIDTYVYCTHYPYWPKNWQKTNNTICVGGNEFNRIQFSVSKDVATTGNEFKEFINNLEEPVKVLAILATPIETPLTSDILSTYSMLRTNYPVTTVLNDSGARMEFSYNADPKNYIDTKLAEIKALIS